MTKNILLSSEQHWICGFLAELRTKPHKKTNPSEKKFVSFNHCLQTFPEKAIVAKLHLLN